MQDIFHRTARIEATLREDRIVFREGAEATGLALTLSRRAIDVSRDLLRQADGLVNASMVQADGTVKDYRCYVLNRRGRTSSRHDIKTETDADAMIRARSITDLSEEFPWVEVWNESRIVGRLSR